MKRKYRGKRVQKRKRNYFWKISAFLIIIALLFGTGFFIKYQYQHFRQGTIIYGVDCSSLTVDEAFASINEYLQKRTITYVFIDGSFSSEANLYDLRLDNIYELQAILNCQNSGSKTRTFTLSNFFVNKLKLKEYMNTFSCFKEESIRKPQNAYLVLGDDNRFYIEPEIIGNELNFDEAFHYALNNLKNGSTNIDFGDITNSKPEVLSTDQSLLMQRDKFNSILDSVINYSLPDGTIFTLDANTIKDWFYKDENGIYQIDLDSNLATFVKELSKKVDSTSSEIEFTTTDLGNIMLHLTSDRRAKVDFELELAQIKTEIGTSINRSPIYINSAFTFEKQTSYVEIDTTRQNVWMYKDGICIVNTPCVTGNYPNHLTPSGIFTLTYKEKDRYLQGTNDDGSKYKSYVNYWMPFNGGIGLHDATWRNKFGGQIYKGNGSHGCVNLPLAAAATIYENITMDMPIVVYSS